VDPPKKGGRLSQTDLQQLAGPRMSSQRGDKGGVLTRWVPTNLLEAIPPFLPDPAPHEGEWESAVTVGQWGRDVTMTPDVVGVRQNLVLLVDNGQVVPAVDSSDHDLWGVTVDNRYFVWRSGVGITADGNIVYAMGPALSMRTLAELLHRAGAVRAMELDINTEWVSFMTYDSIRDPINPPATKLLPEFRQNGGPPRISTRCPGMRRPSGWRWWPAWCTPRGCGPAMTWPRCCASGSRT
jgi:hypothetical protein